MVTVSAFSSNAAGLSIVRSKLQMSANGAWRAISPWVEGYRLEDHAA
jgi:hypothetical protein